MNTGRCEAIASQATQRSYEDDNPIEMKQLYGVSVYGDYNDNQPIAKDNLRCDRLKSKPTGMSLVRSTMNINRCIKRPK